jgi:hypothetical protein
MLKTKKIGVKGSLTHEINSFFKNSSKEGKIKNRKILFFITFHIINFKLAKISPQRNKQRNFTFTQP